MHKARKRPVRRTPVKVLPLPEDVDALILRKDAHRFGYPRPGTLARWACRPSEAPCPVPYTLIGRSAAYRVGDLLALRAALTFRSTSDRTTTTVRRNGLQSIRGHSS
jgi:hypothetical protein